MSKYQYSATEAKRMIFLSEIAQKTIHFQDELIANSDIPDNERVGSAMLAHAIAIAVSICSAHDCLNEKIPIDEFKKYFYATIDLVIEDLMSKDD